MPNLGQNLELSRCPQCSIANPLLNSIHQFKTVDHEGLNRRSWRIYTCSTCGGVVTAWGSAYDHPISGYFPASLEANSQIPDRPRAFLQQAQESLHAPAGAVMLCGSSVDAMLKAKGYIEGSLYARIEKAAADHLITDEMAKWAHEVRLDANDQRHADQSSALPTPQDATRVIEFVNALAEFLFVLPSRVSRGLQASG